MSKLPPLHKREQDKQNFYVVNEGKVIPLIPAPSASTVRGGKGLDGCRDCLHNPECQVLDREGKTVLCEAIAIDERGIIF